MIQPTVGRVVWFTLAIHADNRTDKSQPLAALITKVWGDQCVNVVAFSESGNIIEGLTSVQLVQDDSAPNPNGYYAEWMPFQKGQAAKNEAGLPLAKHTTTEVLHPATGDVVTLNEKVYSN